MSDELNLFSILFCASLRIFFKPHICVSFYLSQPGVSTGIILKFCLRVPDPEKEKKIFSYGNATARSEGLNSSRDRAILGCRWARVQRDGKKSPIKRPITVRHASHLTKFISKRGDAKPSALGGFIIPSHWRMKKEKNDEEIFDRGIRTFARVCSDILTLCVLYGENSSYETNFSYKENRIALSYIIYLSFFIVLIIAMPLYIILSSW